MSAGTNRIITPLILAFVFLTSIPTFAERIIYIVDDGPADFNNIQDTIVESTTMDIILFTGGKIAFGEKNSKRTHFESILTTRNIFTA